MVAIDWFLRRSFANVFVLSDKQGEDRPKSPSAAANVGLVTLGVPQQEVEKPAGESVGVAQGILGYHSALVVSGFFVLEYFVCCRRAPCRGPCLDHALLAESGQTSREVG